MRYIAASRRPRHREVRHALHCATRVRGPGSQPTWDHFIWPTRVCPSVCSRRSCLQYIVWLLARNPPLAPDPTCIESHPSKSSSARSASSCSPTARLWSSGTFITTNFFRTPGRVSRCNTDDVMLSGWRVSRPQYSLNVVLLRRATTSPVHFKPARKSTTCRVRRQEVYGRRL